MSVQGVFVHIEIMGSCLLLMVNSDTDDQRTEWVHEI